nr:beta-lactamase [uncultured bacterium]
MNSSAPSRINRTISGFVVMATFLAVLFVAAPRGSAQEGRSSLPAGKSSIKPFHIIGNIYYVGLNDNTSYLITSPQGHILLDMTYESGVPYIRKNIEQLGFKVKDIKYLLNAHAHADHIGGLAGFKELTGGTVFISEPDAPVIADGGKSDFRNKDGKEEWRPVHADKIVKDNQEVRLDGNVLVAHLTPGHTKGCTTWTTVAEEKGKKYNVVFVCSVGLAGMGIASGVPLLNNPKYPAMADDFAKSFKVLKSLPVDVFLASHGSFFHMAEKIKRMEAGGGSEVWIDPQGYKTYVAEEEKAYLAEVEKEKQTGK